MSYGSTVLSWFQHRPRLSDYLFAAAVTAAGLVGMLLSDVADTERDADLLGVALLLLSTFPLAWRRIHPRNVLIAVAAGSFPFWVLDYAHVVDTGLILGLYAATAHGIDRRSTWRVASTVLVMAAALVVVGSVFVPDENLPLSAILFVPLMLGSAAGLGEVVHQRRLQVAELEQRTRDLEAEVETKSKLATLDERARIAREMHDIVAHGMSVMVVQAGAAKRIVRASPGKAEVALDNIESTGRESLAEMRRMLGVLRDSTGGSDRMPQPALSECNALIDHTIEAGVSVEFAVSGEPRVLAPGLELAAYRVAQEALTNVVKHGGRPVVAQLTIAYEADRIRIDVADNGLGAAATNEAGETGHGLIGMRERAELYLGSLAAGPRDGGGYLVTAIFPTTHVVGQLADPSVRSPLAGSEA